MKRFVGLFCSGFLFMLMIVMTPAFITSASAYSGGFFDDGLYDDDWFFDYYELPADYHHSNRERLREYEVGQMYEGADESGIFNY